MSLLNKVKDFLRKNPDKIDKAAATLDQKTGGKHTDKINKGADQARKAAGPQGNPGAQPPAGGAQPPQGGPPQPPPQ